MPNPYELEPADGFRLPDGNIARMSDVVTETDHHRLRQEIMLIQRALGVRVDGLIGPETRYAIRQLTNSQ